MLRDDGVFWLNYGDCYWGSGGGNNNAGITGKRPDVGATEDDRGNPVAYRERWGQEHQQGSLLLMPHRIALALQADGWIVRQDLVWCLSGGAMLYARTPTSEGPAMLKDLARLKPDTVELWNGESWTRVVQWCKNKKRSGALELVLRSGERIGCTPEHRWPMRWPVAAQMTIERSNELEVGDCIATATLPEPTGPDPAWITWDALWFAGLYLAEGSKSGTTLQLSGHADESKRWDRIKQLAEWYGASARLYVRGKTQAIHIDRAEALSAVLTHLLRGHTAKDKGLAPAAWKLSNHALHLIAQGYLEGDASPQGDRWRLGFTRNYKLEADLRCLAARLGATLTLKPMMASNQTGKFPAFRGEWRWTRSANHNEKDRSEIIEIRRSRAREFWDVTVADEPHLFALASGVLTHNSKPNPMPESVNGWRYQEGELRRGSWRHTRAHEYVFMLTKQMQYWSDGEAVREQAEYGRREQPIDTWDRTGPGARKVAGSTSGANPLAGRNPRSVLHIPTTPYRGAHYATFPPALIAPLILATCPRWCCPVCGQGWAPVVEHASVNRGGSGAAGRQPGDLGGKHLTNEQQHSGDGHDVRLGPTPVNIVSGYRSTCGHPHTQAEAVPGIVCDPFVGSGTTVMVAKQLLRRGIGFDLSMEYLDLQATLRTGIGSPSNQLDNLPLFAQDEIEIS